MNKLIIILALIVGASAYAQGGFYKASYAQSGSNPIDLASLVVKLTPDGISETTENDLITTWTDEASGLNATASGTTRPNLHITAGGQKQVEFDGVDDFMSIANTAAIDFTPGTNAFTIVVRNGATAINSANQQYLIGKAQLATASHQYAIYTQSSLTRFQAGGAASQTNGSDIAVNEVLVMVVKTTGMDVYRNGTKVITNGTIGSSKTANNLIIGARYDGTSGRLNGKISHVLIYNAALTEQEVTDITTYIQ